jgi:hypothetical protein
VTAILKPYKLPSGATNFPVVFSVPTSERIPSLAAKDFTRINLVIIGALTMAFEAMNLKRGMNEFQILNLAEEIIDTSAEDNLSLEDLMLFLQNLVRGKYKLSYESFDIPKFMELFEIYRQERHSTRLNMLENEHLNYKGMGDSNRTSKGDPLADHFNKLGSSLHELRMQLGEKRKEDSVTKQAEKFYGKS